MSGKGEEGAVGGGSNQGAFPAFQKHIVAVQGHEMAMELNDKASDDKRGEEKDPLKSKHKASQASKAEKCSSSSFSSY